MARHGQTASNVVRRYAGRSSETLTDLGRQQVVELGRRLVGQQIGEIWTSQMQRAVASAEILGGELRVGVRLEPRLNEMRLGPWEGLTEQEVAARYPDAYQTWCETPDRLALEERETLAEVDGRVAEVMADAAVGPHPILLVTHVAPMRVAALRVLGLPLAFYKRVEVPNAECLVVDVTGHRVRRLGAEWSLRLEFKGQSPSSSVA